jgi:hypothetical protein
MSITILKWNIAANGVEKTLSGGEGDEFEGNSARIRHISHPHGAGHAKVTLRLSPESKWHKVKLNYCGREAGPGWREAPANEDHGDIDCTLNWSRQKECYGIQWRKRMERGDGKPSETFHGIPNGPVTKDN